MKKAIAAALMQGTALKLCIQVSYSMSGNTSCRKFP